MAREIFNFKRDLSGIGPDTIFNIGSFPITNSTIFILLITLIVIVFSLFALNKKSLVPGKAQAFFELVFEAVHNQIKAITGSEYHTERVFSIIASIFIFIGVSNYLGLVPGLSSITFEGKSLLRTTTADFNTTFAIAFGAIFILQFISIKDFGFWGYVSKYIPVKQLRKDVKMGGLSPIYVFVTILIACLDIVGEFAKVISTSLRLFGNLYAGDVMMTILIGICAFVLPSFWVAFGLLGSLIQTIVFGSLITVYYMQAAGPEPGKQS